MGWVAISDPSKPYNNYLQYLRDKVSENITSDKKEDWVQADHVAPALLALLDPENNGLPAETMDAIAAAGADLYTEALQSLNRSTLGTESNENLWIDPRVLGPRWLGLFRDVSPHAVPIEMVMPEPQ